MFNNIVYLACARASACARANVCVPVPVCVRPTCVCVRVYMCARARVHMCPQKAQKIRPSSPKQHPTPSKKNPFPDRAIARRLAIVPKHSTFLIFFISLWFTF
jgi:hypothetical protein